MKKLRIHYFQHDPSEGLCSIEEWITSAGHSLTSTRFYENPSLPELSAIDWLIVMGGPMNVNDEKEFEWLAHEKKFILEAIENDKIVLGICLGSQLVSAALGARVYANIEKEIGWFDIELTTSAQSGLFSDMGSVMRVFHWHGDTFDLPDNAILLASSAATQNQGYIYKGRVLALQFHLEQTAESMNGMIKKWGADLKGGKYVQTEKEMVNIELLESNKKILFRLLDRLAEL